MINKHFYVYILASKKNGTLYIGVTNNLLRRTFEHKKGIIKGFTDEYSVHALVYYEETENPIAAIEREKQLKRWHREWKVNLIQKENPNWDDLSLALDPETSSG